MRRGALPLSAFSLFLSRFLKLQCVCDTQTVAFSSRAQISLNPRTNFPGLELAVGSEMRLKLDVAQN